jgi:hypothetical protein
MEDVKVYSPIEDKEIRNNLNGSPIWKNAWHHDELPTLNPTQTLFEYSLKFSGLKPIQVAGVKKYNFVP